MDEQDWMATRFEENRAHLRAVAYRMLGSATEADDAVQEAWLRLSRADTTSVENLSGWLTTVVARVCLNMLRSKRTRREEPLEEYAAEPTAVGLGPEQDALLADSVGPALLIVLDTLAPAERLAFVLHDMFAVPFNEIATIVGRSPEATRQLASRARRRVQGAHVGADVDVTRHRELVEAFLAATREGNFEGLLAVLDPDVVLRADSFAVRAGARGEVRGAQAVASGAIVFSTRSRLARLALIDGLVGAVLAPGGRVTTALSVTVRDGRIAGMEVVGDPDRLAEMDIVLLDA